MDRSEVMEFLMGLNESYEYVRGQIVMMDHLPNMESVYAMLSNVESQQEVSVMVPENFNPVMAIASPPSPSQSPVSINAVKSNTKRDLSRRLTRDL